MIPKSQTEFRSEKILATLKEHYKLGCKAKRLCTRAKSPESISLFASKNGVDARTARMRLAFAQQYSQADFDEFCKLRRVVKSQGNSQGEKTFALPLLSAHVTYLLTIEAAVQNWNAEHTQTHRDARILRRELAQLAADKNLKPKQLHDVIRRTFGRSQSVSHGRKHFLASNLKTAVNKFFDEGENWFTRGQLLVSKIASDPKLKKQKAVDELRSILSTGELRCRALRGLLNREEGFETAKRKKSGGRKKR